MKSTFWAARNLQKRVCSSTWKAATYQKDKLTTRMWVKEHNHQICNTCMYKPPEVQTHSTLPPKNISPPHTHHTNRALQRKETPTTPQRHNQHNGLTQLTLMTESPIPKQNYSPHPATTNPNPIQPTENNVGKTIQGKCHALEKTQTSKQLLT